MPIGFTIIYATIRELGQNLQWWYPHGVQSGETVLTDVAHHVLGAAWITCVAETIKLCIR